MINPSRLVQELNNTGLQNKDTPLYQLLLNLIRLTLSITNSINAGATNINPSTIETIIIQQAMQGMDGLNGEDGMSIIGAKGDTGATGSIGLTGAIGARGFDGIDGEDGLSIPGPKGDTGLTGATGATGASGASSGSISSDNDGYDNDLMSYPNIIGPFTKGSVLFYDGKITEDNANLFWDNTNKRLGIGTSSPASKLHILDKITAVAPSSAVTMELRGRSSDNAGYESFRSNDGATEYGFIQSGPTDFYIGGLGTSVLHLWAGSSERVTIGTTGIVTLTAPITLKGYTVAGLPAGVVGHLAYCTDLLAPTFLTAATGGGGITGPVFYNGANWVTI